LIVNETNVRFTFLTQLWKWQRHIFAPRNGFFYRKIAKLRLLCKWKISDVKRNS
jgi:hypothetical protein